MAKTKPSSEIESEKRKEPKRNSNRAILWKFVPWLFFLLSLLVLIFLPLWVLDYMDSQKQLQESTVYSDFVYSFPSKEEDKTPFATFRFPTEREAEDRLFQFRLDGLDTQVSFRLVLAYNPDDESLQAELDRRIIQVIDQIESTIARKSFEEIDSIEEREFYLKSELLNEINSFLREGKITNIFFTQFLLSKIVEG